MAKIAPEQRITIHYTPHNSNTPKELPLRLLTMGNFKGNAHAEVDTPVGMRTPVQIDNITFDTVMAAAGIGLKTRLDQHASLLDTINRQKTTQPLDIHLRFSKLQDFNPDSLIKQIPELHAMVQLRDLLTDLKNSHGSNKPIGYCAQSPKQERTTTNTHK